MKTIMKIEVVIIALLLVAIIGLTLGEKGFFSDPVIEQRPPATIPTEPEENRTIPEVYASYTAPRLAEDITAKQYFAYDIRKEDYLLKSGDGNERLYPASITKLMSAYVALQYLDLEDTLEVGEELELVQSGSSVAGLEAGDRLTVSQLIAGMLLPSGNDAAQTVAAAAGRRIAGDESISCEAAVAEFVAQMNRQAEVLGMANSHFENPDGFHHDNHYTTVDDLVILCREVLAIPAILEFASQAEYSVELPERTLEWKNSNLLLDETMEMYLPNAIGLKTGYTSEAGNCLISALFMEDRVWLIGVFGCPEQTQDRYLDTIAIYEALL